LIRPILLYGSETWVLTEKEENQLLVFERKFLRTICGTKIENGGYERRYNHELNKKFTSPNALNVTKTNIFRHMIRKPEERPKEKLKKTEIQVDGWGEQRLPGHIPQDKQTWRDLLQQALTRYWL
jgi:hypothetical protein